MKLNVLRIWMKVESRHLPSKAICLTKSQVFLVFEMEAGWKSSGNSTQVVNYDPYISVWKRHDNDWRWEWDIWQLDGHDPSTYLTPGCITIMSDCWLVKFTSILNFTSRLLLRQILSKKTTDSIWVYWTWMTAQCTKNITFCEWPFNDSLSTGLFSGPDCQSLLQSEFFHY